jgi:class 3 adenylate cyclase
MVDHPNRSKPRFPEQISKEIKAAILEILVEKNIRIGYSSLACGGDILFVEALLEMGGEPNIYLPFSKSDFLETSVEFAGQEWVDRFKKIIANSKINFITEENFFGDDSLYHLLGKVLIGTGVIRANLMHSKPLLLTVLSERDLEEKVGGSRSVQSIWPFGEESIININPDQFHSGAYNILESHEVEHEELNEIQREIRYILFADIAGFSKMQEEQTPFFMHNLLTRISRELQDYPKPRIFNTWGDSIFAVFREARFAAEYSFKLLEVFRSVDWAKENLPANLDIRIALHAGPVFVGMDPLTRKLNAYGAHINRTARMEPVTLPGTIYASEQFAATLAVESFEKYNYRHVGLVKLAKDYGYQEIYRIDEKERTALST